MSTSRLRKYVVGPAKVIFAIGLLAVLIYQAREGYRALKGQPKELSLLAVALVSCTTSLLLTFFRWYLLVRALGLPFTLHDAMRLGCQGFALNFASLGSVGGDLFKAVFIAREQHGHRTEAVATVVIDRLVGLYALLLVAAGAILLSGLNRGDQPSELQIISQATLACTVIGGLGIATLVIPGVTGGRVTQAAGRVPAIGATLQRVLQAVTIYRSRYGVIIWSLLISVVVHWLAALSVWLIARGMLPAAPPLVDHLVIVPLANLVGALPLTPSGLGTLEAALGFLYEQISQTVTRDQGFMIAILFRLMTMVVALAGVIYIIRGRREVAAVLHEAEEEEGE